jgi:hypothetical protein
MKCSSSPVGVHVVLKEVVAVATSITLGTDPLQQQQQQQQAQQWLALLAGGRSALAQSTLTC